MNWLDVLSSTHYTVNDCHEFINVTKKHGFYTELMIFS